MYIYIYIYIYGLVRGWGSIPGRVIPKTQTLVLNAALLNIQHYKLLIKFNLEQYRERSNALPYTSI